MQRYVLLALLSIAIIGAIAHFRLGFSDGDLSGHAWGSDDAYISYRYARNLADGHGLVFNPGEKVEGYSNLLYILFVLAFIKIAPDFVYVGCFVFNLLMYATTLILFLWYLKRVSGESQLLPGCLALCMCPIMWAWPAFGIETSSVVLVQLALFIAADFGSRRPSTTFFLLFCCLAGVAILLRSDGFVFPLLCSMVFILRKRYRYFVGAITIIVILSGIYVIARYSYYGEVLPNTFYAKVSGPLTERLIPAAIRLARLCIRDAFVLYLAPLVLGWRSFIEQLRGRSKWDTTAIPVIPFISVGLLTYWAYVGGDVFNERFLLVLVPLSIAHLLAKGYRLVSSQWKVPALICFVALQFTPFAFDSRFAYRLAKYDRWIELGKHLAIEHPNATLAIDAAGKVPFYSRLLTIDMLGLNDAHIGRKPASYFSSPGHNKYDPDYVLARRPDLIAAWGSKNFDLAWGITRETYVSAGYTLKYLLNTSPHNKPQNIVDVTNLGQDRIVELYLKGYKYYVISRKPVIPFVVF